MNGLEISTGEAWVFWTIGPLMVAGALGLLLAKRIVHIAVAVAGVMIGMAVLYVTNDAQFLGVAQVVVYTGAVMMLFLFVIMLVGVDTSESLKETLSGQRIMTVVAGIGLIALLASVIARATIPAGAGLAEANSESNPVGVARLIFSDFIFPFELTGALLITAALGAITLTHRVRLSPPLGQAETAKRTMAAYGKDSSSRVAVHPGPGIFARHNSADMPGLDPQGRPIQESITTVLRVRGQEKTAPDHLELGEQESPEQHEQGSGEGQSPPAGAVGHPDDHEQSEEGK